MRNLIYLFFLAMTICTSAQDTIKSDTISSDNDPTLMFAEVDEKPAFPGGDEALINYLIRNTHYPPKAVKKNIKGTVYLSFIIEKDGSVTNVKVLRPVDPLLDKEAKRVVSEMPDWIPGKHKGKNVRVSYIVPIKFILGCNHPKKSKK